jgi:hypothetical protein
MLLRGRPADGQKGGLMRSAGFPCRVAGCDQSFNVADQRSMDALFAASAARAKHEVVAHDYHHVPMEDNRIAAPYGRTKPKEQS